ncbi:YsnF/AvaK domain-containing protein [Sporichthya sp.]|uniref:YsnF/AvaK domain-containing protein n=1 Tax=Sporichthya sp. TaxID=65475 RepID=UPI0017B945B1|nr:YsnF/AvaK domain-containing protein [Sporichthya sp.]MBA3744672.1 YsnF/AvaK domain-containing protein [Sporichthya sp.]
MTTIDDRTLSTLAGHPVRSTHGAKIGKVVDVYASAQGTGTFLSVSTGLFGGAASFVPLELATMDGDCVVVPYGHDLVKDAPRVGAGHALSAAEEDLLYSHYQLTPPDGPDEIAPPVPEFREPAAAGTDDAMTRSEQQLTVGTSRRESGRARLHKYVVTETVTATVAVSHDEVRIEREEITETNLAPAMAGRDLTAAVHEVVLTEEVAFSGKVTAPVERVRMVTEEVTEQVTVAEDLGREVIEVERTN